jgi:hypothetical protein
MWGRPLDLLVLLKLLLGKELFLSLALLALDPHAFCLSFPFLAFQCLSWSPRRLCTILSAETNTSDATAHERAEMDEASNLEKHTPVALPYPRECAWKVLQIVLAPQQHEEAT